MSYINNLYYKFRFPITNITFFMTSTYRIRLVKVRLLPFFITFHCLMNKQLKSCVDPSSNRDLWLNISIQIPSNLKLLTFNNFNKGRGKKTLRTNTHCTLTLEGKVLSLFKKKKRKAFPQRILKVCPLKKTLNWTCLAIHY